MPATIADLKKLIHAQEKRIVRLERLLLSKEKKPTKVPDFKGLTGGIEFLVSKNFLGVPRPIKEIVEELRKEGYHYGEKSVEKIVRVNFMQKRKILTRIKEERVWKYVLRK
jgi:hypothetical protein